MGIFINGIDVSKNPFGGRVVWNGQLGEIFNDLDAPVEPVRYATDSDFKVWALTGGRLVEAGKDSGSNGENATDGVDVYRVEAGRLRDEAIRHATDANMKESNG